MKTYIDFLTLPILINGALFYLCFRALRAWGKTSELKALSPGFLLGGALQSLTGFQIVFTWPLNGVFNIAYGEPLLFCGLLTLALGFCLYQGHSIEGLWPLGILAGLQCLVAGGAIIYYSLSADPVIVGFMFLGVGISILLSCVFYRIKMPLRVPSYFFFLLFLIWSLAGLRTYFVHLNPVDGFGAWKPKTSLSE